MPRGHRLLLPVHFGSSLWKSAATAIVYKETVGGVEYILAVDGTTHAIISGPTVVGTDDVAINATVVYVNALGGGSIYIEESSYTLTATITMYSDILIYGSGESTILTASGNFHLMTLTNLSNVSIKDFTFAGTSEGNNVDCIFVDSSVASFRIHISRLFITDSDRHGIHFEGTGWARRIWIIDNHITGTDEDGIYADYLARSDISGNIIVDTGEHGFDANRIQMCTISDNIFYSVGTAVTHHGLNLYSQTIYTTIVGNVFASNAGRGINYDFGAGNSFAYLTKTAG